MRVRRGRPPKLTLDPAESDLLRTLVKQVDELLEADSADLADRAGDDELAGIVGPMDSGDEADDPVVRRLLPDAYRDDEAAAADWRRLGRGEVRAVKSEAMQRVLADVADDGPATIRLDDEHLGRWLPVLTDVRLALGERIGVTEDWVEEAARLDEDDPLRDAYAIYDWLSMLQETILQAVM